MLEQQFKHFPRGSRKVHVVNQIGSCGSKALQYAIFKYPYKPTVCLLFSGASYYGSSPKHVLGRNHSFLCASPPMTLRLG